MSFLSRVLSCILQETCTPHAGPLLYRPLTLSFAFFDAFVACVTDDPFEEDDACLPFSRYGHVMVKKMHKSEVPVGRRSSNAGAADVDDLAWFNPPGRLESLH